MEQGAVKQVRALNSDVPIIVEDIFSISFPDVFFMRIYLWE